MDPSTVRERILAEHEGLRAECTALERTAHRVIAGTEPGDTLRSAGSAFLERLEDHLALEDRILLPALRDIDAWGDVRAESIESDHARQRRQFAEMLHDLEDAATTASDVAERMLVLIADLRHDLAEEDETALHPDLLRDDAVTVDFISS